jgi:hypothetical protein
MASLGTDGAPPVLPIGTLLAGALVLLAGAVALLFNAGLLTGPVSSPGMVALVHVFTLGFVGLVFAGTLQQLPAVMFVTTLAWPLLGYLTTPLLLLGTASIVYGFAAGFAPAWLAAGAVAVSLAWILLLVQLFATALRRWPSDAASHALILSVVFLALTVIAGFLLASARATPSIAATVGYPLRLHLTLGIFGAFLLGIIGSGQKLFSMFALSKGGEQWRVRLSIYLVTAAILAEALAAFTAARPGPLPVLLLAAASLLQLLEVQAIFRRRLRRKLEAPIARYVLAHMFLPVAGLLLLLGQPVATAAAFLVGYIGLAVSGMLVKIMSFLVWTAMFASSRNGGVSGGAPLLRDLMRDELEPVTTWSLAAGALALCATLLTQALPLAYLAGALLLVGALSQFLQVTNIVVTAGRAGRRLKHQAELAAGARPAAAAEEAS